MITEPCSKVSNWIVMSTPICIRQDHVQQVLFTAKWNCRTATKCFGQKRMIWIFISKIMFIDTNSRNIFSVGISFLSTGTQSTKHGQVRTIKTSNVFILQSPIFSRCLHSFFIFKKITRINWIKSVLNLAFIFIKTKKKHHLKIFQKDICPD